MKKRLLQIRQGDVLLTQCEEPKKITRTNDSDGRPMAGLLVAGERTGHAHRLPARVYDTPAGRVLFLERPTPITHEEHAHIEVPAGWWEITLQREYAPRRKLSRSRVD
jgi:hypothetical protein